MKSQHNTSFIVLIRLKGLLNQNLIFFENLNSAKARQGAYGVVLKTSVKQTKETVALKSFLCIPKRN